jgi:hypothetical protein
LGNCKTVLRYLGIKKGWNFCLGTDSSILALYWVDVNSFLNVLKKDQTIRTLDLQLPNFCYYQTRKVKNSHAIQTLSLNGNEIYSLIQVLSMLELWVYVFPSFHFPPLISDICFLRKFDENEQKLVVSLLRLVSICLDHSSTEDLEEIVFDYIRQMKTNFLKAKPKDKNLILKANKNSFKFNLHLPNISSLLTLRSAYLMHGDFGLSDGSLVCSYPINRSLLL